MNLLQKQIERDNRDFKNGVGKYEGRNNNLTPEQDAFLQELKDGIINPVEYETETDFVKIDPRVRVLEMSKPITAEQIESCRNMVHPRKMPETKPVTYTTDEDAMYKGQGSIRPLYMRHIEPVVDEYGVTQGYNILPGCCPPESKEDNKSKLADDEIAIYLDSDDIMQAAQNKYYQTMSMPTFAVPFITEEFNLKIIDHKAIEDADNLMMNFVASTKTYINRPELVERDKANIINTVYNNFSSIAGYLCKSLINNLNCILNSGLDRDSYTDYLFASDYDLKYDYNINKQSPNYKIVLMGLTDLYNYKSNFAEDDSPYTKYGYTTNLVNLKASMFMSALSMYLKNDCNNGYRHVDDCNGYELLWNHFHEIQAAIVIYFQELVLLADVSNALIRATENKLIDFAPQNV